MNPISMVLKQNHKHNNSVIKYIRDKRKWLYDVQTRDIQGNKQSPVGYIFYNPLHYSNYYKHIQNQGKIYSFVFTKQHMLVLASKCAYIFEVNPNVCLYVR